MIQLINFVLITLIIYNLFNNNILEHFSGCSKSKSNAVYRQQAVTDRLFGKINKLKAKYQVLKNLSAMNKLGVQANKQNTDSGIGKLESDLKSKESEMKNVGGKPAKPIKGIFKGSKIFARAFG